MWFLEATVVSEKQRGKLDFDVAPPLCSKPKAWFRFWVEVVKDEKRERVKGGDETWGV